MRTIAVSARIAVALLLGLLGLGYLFFGVANARYVEALPQNLDVVVETVTALIAAGALVWSAVNQVRRRPWARIALVGGVVFGAGMLLSVSTGASTPSMLQVTVPALVVGGLAWFVEARRAARRARSGELPA